MSHFRGLRILLAILFATCFGGKALSANSIEVASIPVPKNVIYAGQMIDQHLLKQRRVPARYLLQVSVITEVRDVSGMVARTTLMPNRPIPTNYVVAPDIVQTGKPAILVFNSGGLSISGEVIPMNSAKVGGHVRARNVSSGTIVSGIAQADGSISVITR